MKVLPCANPGSWERRCLGHSTVRAHEQSSRIPRRPGDRARPRLHHQPPAPAGRHWLWPRRGGGRAWVLFIVLPGNSFGARRYSLSYSQFIGGRSEAHTKIKTVTFCFEHRQHGPRAATLTTGKSYTTIIPGQPTPAPHSTNSSRAGHNVQINGHLRPAQASALSFCPWLLILLPLILIFFCFFRRMARKLRKLRSGEVSRGGADIACEGLRRRTAGDQVSTRCRRLRGRQGRESPR